MQIDLFDIERRPPSAPAGFTHAYAVIDEAEEHALIRALKALPLAPFRFQGWEGKRLTLSFGWSYDFETAQVAAAPPMPDWLLPLRARAASFMGLAEDDLRACRWHLSRHIHHPAASTKSGQRFPTPCCPAVPPINLWADR